MEVDNISSSLLVGDVSDSQPHSMVQLIDSSLLTL